VTSSHDVGSRDSAGARADGGVLAAALLDDEPVTMDDSSAKGDDAD
jgi:hypothetical protein